MFRFRAWFLGFGLVLGCSSGSGSSQSTLGDGAVGSEVDADGDNINDFDEGKEGNLDTDSDGLPDFQDDDSDGDAIFDADEAGDRDLISAPYDSDADGIPNFRDLDSDGDCIADALEAGDTNPQTLPDDGDKDNAPDFLDVDSDADGLADGKEDKDCDHAVDPGESSSYSSDSDNDGASDLVENAAGTDPQKQSDNPRAHGDFVFVVPFEKPPEPKNDDLFFSTSLKKVDLYVLMDASGSMQEEIKGIKSSLNSVIDNLSCKPGKTTDCIKDLWSGLGTFTYAERDPYHNLVSLQPDPIAFSSVDLYPDIGDCAPCFETQLFSLWSTLSGKGTAESSCQGFGESVPKASDCADSPAGADGFGYPCFRKDSLAIVMMATDESVNESFTCPSFGALAIQFYLTNAKVIGILGSNATKAVKDDLDSLAKSSGTTDSDGKPFVFYGPDNQSAQAIEDAVKAIMKNLAMTVEANVVDDASDEVNAVEAFVDSLQVQPLGTTQCSDEAALVDIDGDGQPETFEDVLPGTPLCWQIAIKQNQTVVPTTEPQLFRATVGVIGEKSTALDSRDVYFLVPPELPTLGID